MNMSNSKPTSHDPQRRNRGTKIRTPPSISATPSASVPGKASTGATWNSARNCDHLKGSDSFQAPETKKTIASNTAQTPPISFFQAGRSTLTRPSPKSDGLAVVSDICTSYFTGLGSTLDCRERGKVLASGLASYSNIVLGVRRRKEPRFVLRRGQIDAAIQHPMEELAKTCRIGPFR